MCAYMYTINQKLVIALIFVNICTCMCKYIISRNDQYFKVLLKIISESLIHINALNRMEIN